MDDDLGALLRTAAWNADAWKIWEQLPDGRIVPDRQQAHDRARARELARIRAGFATIRAYWLARMGRG